MVAAREVVVVAARVVAPVVLTIPAIIGVRTLGHVRQVQVQVFLVRNAVTTTVVVPESRHPCR